MTDALVQPRRGDGSRVARALRGTPTFFLVDRAGTVRLKRLGLSPEGELGARIQPLLAQ